MGRAEGPEWRVNAQNLDSDVPPAHPAGGTPAATTLTVPAHPVVRARGPHNNGDDTIVVRASRPHISRAAMRAADD
jgi:hypothetical protein